MRGTGGEEEIKKGEGRRRGGISGERGKRVTGAERGTTHFAMRDAQISRHFEAIFLIYCGHTNSTENGVLLYQQRRYTSTGWNGTLCCSRCFENHARCIHLSRHKGAEFDTDAVVCVCSHTLADSAHGSIRPTKRCDAHPPNNKSPPDITTGRAQMQIIFFLSRVPLKRPKHGCDPNARQEAHMLDQSWQTPSLNTSQPRA